jgi:hypothetical protein
VIDVLTIEECQRPLWEGDQEVAKRSGREPMWVAIFKCLEAMLGISLVAIFI